MSREPACLPQDKRENNQWVWVTSDVLESREIKRGEKAKENWVERGTGRGGSIVHVHSTSVAIQLLFA